MAYGDKGAGVVISIGAPPMGEPGGEMKSDYHDDPMTLQAIEDATAQFFKAGQAGDYKKASQLLCQIVDMKQGMDPYSAGMEYSDNPGYHPGKGKRRY